MRDYASLDKFLDALVGDVYPEIPSEPHITFTKETIDRLSRGGLIAAGNKVLDIGCGQGLALEIFRELGLEATGITLGSDGDLCRAKGFDVREMDQSFLTFDDGAFDLLWCRHVLEHSIAPLFTLHEYHRILRPNGLAYIEVPAPDTSAHHETNANHYSVLPLSSWRSLFPRVGFSIEQAFQHTFEVPCGPDMYWSFLLRRGG